MARIILNESTLLKSFQVNDINTTCYVLKKVLIRPILKKTPYKLYFERKQNVSHLFIFGYKCFVYNYKKDEFGKFDAKADDALFVGYSSTCKAF